MLTLSLSASALAAQKLPKEKQFVLDWLFEGVDAVIDNHGGEGFSTAYGVSGNAVFSFTVTFTGRTAHSAGAPWQGRSALDAVELMNYAVELLREYLYITHRIHYVITDGGEAPNVVPETAGIHWRWVQ